MPYKVSFTIPERDLGKSAIEFVIKDRGAKLGSLKVSKGSVVWVRRDCTYGFKLSWKQLGQLMEESGTRE